MSGILCFSLAAATATVFAIALAWRRPEAIVRHPLVVLGIVGAISAASILAIVSPAAEPGRISLDPSEEPLLPVNEPGRAIHDEAVRNFGHDDVFVIAMETDDVFTHAHLKTLRDLSERVRRLPGVRATESLVDTTAYRYRAGDDLFEVGALIDEIPEDARQLAELRARALNDPIYPKAIVSQDGRSAAINIFFRPMSDREFVEHRLDERIHAIIEDVRRPGERFFVTGRQHIKARAYHLMLSDVLRLIPIAVIVGTFVAWTVTGKFRNAVVPVGVSLLATLWTFGAIAVLGHPLNLITIVLGPMLICIGSVYGVHVMARFDELACDSGESRASAVACLRYTYTPVMISGTTTVAGFSSVLVSDTPAITEFGLFSVLGVCALLTISLTALPALLGVLPLPAPRRAVGVTDRLSKLAIGFASDVIGRLLTGLLGGIARLTTGRPLLVIGAWTVGTVAAAACIPRIAVDTDYLTFFDPRSDIRRDFRAVSDLLVGAVPIYVVLSGGGGGAFREPVNLQALERLQRLVDAIPEVSATLSVIDLIKLLNRAVEKDDPAAARIPDSRAGAAEVMFLIPKNKLRRYANANHSKVNLLVRTGESGSAAILALERRLLDAITEARLPAGITAEVTGNAIVFNKGSDAIVGNQVGTVGLATFTIFVLVVYAFRSVRIGVLAMVPNVVPVAMYFGMLGLGVAPLSLPTSLIGSVALGISIDDTAHFLAAYQHRRKWGMETARATAEGVRTLGPPIITTSLMLIAGYLVLWLSEFATLRQFGYLSAATMLICLCGDLTLLPSILVKADR